MREDGQGSSSQDLWAEAPVVSGSWPHTYLKEEHSKERGQHVQRL